MVFLKGFWAQRAYHQGLLGFFLGLRVEVVRVVVLMPQGSKYEKDTYFGAYSI